MSDNPRQFALPGNDVSGYLGVDPEYMTYANETEKPYLTPQEMWDYTDQLSHLEGNAEGEEGEGGDEPKPDWPGPTASGENLLSAL